jgi:MoxR-like ATPase
MAYREPREGYDPDWVKKISTKLTTEEEAMKREVTDEIMDILNSRRDDILEADPIIESSDDVIVEPVVSLKATPWIVEDGISTRRVPFSEKYWKLTSDIPDHMVSEYKGYASPTPPDIYIPPKAEFEQLSLAFSLSLKVNVIGPTGAGKTLMYEYYAASTGRPFLRVDHNTSFDKESVFGQVHINVDADGKQSTDYVPGVFPRSMSEPTVVLLDELTRATGYSNMIYQRVLDRNEFYMPEMKEAGVSVLLPHADWQICASDNTKGNGEDLEKYPMSNVQDAAFINRWDLMIEQDYMTAKEEEQLIKQLSPSLTHTQVNKLAKFSSLIHIGFKKGEIQTAFSPRNLVTIAALFNAGVELKTAINMNYVSRCAKSEQSDVKECLRSTFGGV